MPCCKLGLCPVKAGGNVDFDIFNFTLPVNIPASPPLG